MCGSSSDKDLHDPRRFGAMAVLRPHDAAASLPAGRVVFFNETDHTSSTATHVSFTPSGLAARDHHQHGGHLALTIFSTGDLTLPLSECAPLERLDLLLLGGATTTATTAAAASSSRRLGRSLRLRVGGDDGIIGRRVAVTASGACVAEGIVGFNHGALPVCDDC